MDVDGLSALTSTDGLFISGNTSLAKCACGLYALIGGGGAGDFVLIENNAPGCNSPTEVTAQACVECAGMTLAEDIDALVAGIALSARQGHWLANRLRLVLKQAGKEHIPQAIRQLDAFVNRVTKLDFDGEIDPETTEMLLSAAGTMRDALEAQI